MYFTSENTRNLGESVRRTFSLKNTKNRRAVGRMTFIFTIKMSLRRILCGMHNDSLGSVEGGILYNIYIYIRNRDVGLQVTLAIIKRKIEGRASFAPTFF